MSHTTQNFTHKNSTLAEQPLCGESDFSVFCMLLAKYEVGTKYKGSIHCFVTTYSVKS